MNKRNFKRLTLHEAQSALPKWWLETLLNVLSILRHSDFTSFSAAKTFVESALSFLPKEENKEIKRVLAKCEPKGERDNHIYFTLTLFFKMENEDSWQLSKSLHVRKRSSIQFD